MYDCWHSARFFRHAELAAPEGLTVQARGKGNVCVDGKLYPFGKEIPLSAGSHEIMIDLCREDGLPCLYVENGSLSGTEGWMVHPFAGEKVSVGSSPLFTRPEQDPEVFPFVYEEIHPVENRPDERGTLYDFGRETFARVFLELEDQPAFSLCFGESETEARGYVRLPADGKHSCGNPFAGAACPGLPVRLSSQRRTAFPAGGIRAHAAGTPGMLFLLRFAADGYLEHSSLYL